MESSGWRMPRTEKLGQNIQETAIPIGMERSDIMNLENVLWELRLLEFSVSFFLVCSFTDQLLFSFEISGLPHLLQGKSG